MSTSFVDALRECLKTGGWASKDNEREEGGTFLVGVRGQLFAIHEDYQVAKAADGFATAGTGLSPRRRVIRALKAAERFNSGVRGPFLCLKT